MPFVIKRDSFLRYSRKPPIYTSIIIFISLIIFSLMIFSNIHKLGIFPDAINPDYIAVHILHPSGDTVAYTLKGNLLWNRLPVLAGGIYHGSIHAYLGVPFILFGATITTFIFSHLFLGALSLLVAFFFVGWASRCCPIAVCAVALMGVDPAYIFTWRTEAYITTFPTTFVLLALWLILKADDRDDGHRLHAFSGALIGVAFWGYFIHIFFVPGIVLTIYWRNRRDLGHAAALLGHFVFGLCCGAIFYFIDYALYFKELGLWGGIEGLRQALASMRQVQAALAEASLWDRLLHSFSMLRLALTGEFHDIAIFGGGDFPLQQVKMGLLILTPLIGIPFALGDARASRAFRLVGACILSFLAVSVFFGNSQKLEAVRYMHNGLGGHHFCALLPLFYAAFALAAAGIANTAGHSWQKYSYIAAAAIGTVLLFVNVSAYSQIIGRLSNDQATKFYSPVVNNYPLIARDRFRDYTHVFMNWGIMPFVYLTDGKVRAVDNWDPAFPNAVMTAPQKAVMTAAICSGKPVNVVFLGDHAMEEAQNTLDRLKLRADIQNYSPTALRFQYVVATLEAPDRSYCP